MLRLTKNLISLHIFSFSFQKGKGQKYKLYSLVVELPLPLLPGHDSVVVSIVVQDFIPLLQTPENREPMIRHWAETAKCSVIEPG